ncbi:MULTISPECIES: 50S ribosomal protein L4 [Spirosoma]|uniref:50S ribosomal protein L4 n=1 Tax=Spirosoma TaxID=107 RepID=UPI0009687EA7|nr:MULTISPECIES: 50S ribosomal protein L4 [Spirosoma]MBN8822744.1 50S ribosomal protein L4 [Spirosoma sp.]OJW79955.1 MAG: 50S ribosomal protein L4 [Spirosoma sp. 48-14]
MEVIVYNSKGEDTGKKVTLSEEIFGIEPNQHAIYLDVKQYLANQRQGTHKAKERAEVARSTRKLKKQKGTGGARAGSAKSPVFVGGGTVFGPRPRDYSFKLNKKVKSLARQSAYAVKARANSISVIDSISLEAPRTKDYIQFLNDLNVSGRKTLLILPDVNTNVVLSSRNVQKAKVTTAAQVNTYDLMNADQLLISEEALSTIQTLFEK